jgi:hypothetical protein
VVIFACRQILLWCAHDGDTDTFKETAGAASLLEKAFQSSCKSVGKSASEFDSGFLGDHGHSSSQSARATILSSWDRYRLTAPPVGGSLPRPHSTVPWPPLCWEAIKQSRIYFSDDVGIRGAPVEAEVIDTEMNRVTSRVASVQREQQAVSLQSFVALKQPEVAAGKFHVVLSDDHPGFWIVQIESVVLGRGVSPSHGCCRESNVVRVAGCTLSTRAP